jgi:hypothetical protein
MTEYTGKIIPINVNEHMKSAYIDYSMSVIVSRGATRCARWFETRSQACVVWDA